MSSRHEDKRNFSSFFFHKRGWGKGENEFQGLLYIFEKDGATATRDDAGDPGLSGKPVSCGPFIGPARRLVQLESAIEKLKSQYDFD